jgi:hypothetical protein
MRLILCKYRHFSCLKMTPLVSIHLPQQIVGKRNNLPPLEGVRGEEINDQAKTLFQPQRLKMCFLKASVSAKVNFPPSRV